MMIGHTVQVMYNDRSYSSSVLWEMLLISEILMSKSLIYAIIKPLIWKQAQIDN